jgi:exonuclease SbcD
VAAPLITSLLALETTMRVLHTSDWHVGKTLYNASRAEDHDTVLNEITGVARSEKPHLIVHSGDLFDRAVPSYADVVKANIVLDELAATAPVVVICGNHDSLGLFQVYQALKGPDSRVHFVDSPRDPHHGGVLRFRGPDDVTLRLAVLPFVHANRAINAFDDARHWRVSYAERIGRYERALADELFRDFDPGRDIAMFAAHLYVGGARFASSERPLHTSDYYATQAEDLPAVSYAAFGHIHKPQPLPNTQVTGRYAGSPIPLDFGEVGEHKSVVLADLRPGQPTHLDLVPLSGGRQLRQFNGPLDALRAIASTVGRALCLVTIHTPTHDPNLSAKVRDLLPDATILDVHEQCADQQLDIARPAAEAGPDAEPDMRELFREYLAQGMKTTTVAADRLLETFGLIFDSVEEERPVCFPEEQSLLDPPTFPAPATAGEASR